MSKTILITGSTDGIGLETAKILLDQGHRVILHGRNPEKAERVKQRLSLHTEKPIEVYIADLSKICEVRAFAQALANDHEKIDVLINNAGVLSVSQPMTADGLDIRFAVNTVAPYILTKRLLPQLGTTGRVINLSSAPQTSVNLAALRGEQPNLPNMTAYSQSKLALNIWSHSLALSLGDQGPMIVAVNPGSLLGSKMVKEGFGVQGKDISIGAKILVQAALSDEFAHASGKYFDNDKGKFSNPHSDVFDSKKSDEVMRVLNQVAGE